MLNRQMSFFAALIAITFSLTLVAALAVPIKVTVDGVNYISSAKALFSSEMVTHYVWYREPGYPLFLKVINFFSDAGILLVVLQGFCLGLAAGIAFYVLRKSSGQQNAKLGQVLVAIVLAGNPMFLIYAGLVLQQALFALLLSLYALLLLWSIHTPTFLNSFGIGTIVVGLYIASISTSVGWIYLGLFPTVSVLVILITRQILRKLNNKRLKSNRIFLTTFIFLVSIAVLCVTYILGTQTYKTWEAYKDSEMPTSYSMPSVIKPLETVPYIPSPFELSSRMLSLMGIGLQEPYIYENKLFLDQQMRLIWPVSEWDTAYVSKPYSDFAEGYFSLTNPNIFAHRAMSFSSEFAFNAYRMIFVLSFATILWSIFKRKWLFIAIQLLPIYYIFVYAASNSPIDRYGVPAFAFAAASVGVLISWSSKLLRNRFGSS